MEVAYADRVTTVNTDGTPVFYSEQDRAKEAEIVALVSERWKCEVKQFAHLSPIDFYIQRHGRLLALAELKSRDHTSKTYPTVYFNVRKWAAIMAAGCGMGINMFFIARFTDNRIGWVRVEEIDARKVIIGGTRSRNGQSAYEPLIEVPIAQLTWFT